MPRCLVSRLPRSILADTWARMTVAEVNEMAVFFAAVAIAALVEKALSLIGWALSIVAGFAVGLMRRKW